MGQALYRKYRSRSFDEVVGQDHITKTLKNAIKNGKISHAYLFTGPHGVGKTSVARILAHEINALPYSDERIHLDIIEIDAASNSGVDEIRELRERVHIAPTSAKYKVYIIDEVHMLSRQAFNALLKTLEEPPAHCIFILATTEAHKLPDTIVSRTQRFGFKPVSKQQSAEHLGYIAKKEGIDITQAALDLLADFGAGSFRDSISLLDQLSGSKKVDESEVRRMLGLPPAEAVNNLLGQIQAGDSKEVLGTLDSLRDQAVDSAVLAKQLSRALRTQLLEGNNDDWLPALLKELLSVPASNDPDSYLEICLLEVANNNSGTTHPAPKVESYQEPVAKIAAESEPTPPEPEPEPETPVSVPKKPVKTNFDLDDWPEVLEKAKAKNGPLYSTLRLDTPQLEEDKLTIIFKFPLHQKKLSQAQNVDLLGELIEENYGVKLNIKSKVDKDLQPPAAKKPAPQALPAESNVSIESISNIFGNAEVLES